MKFACGISLSFVGRYYLRGSVAKSPASLIRDMSIMYAYARVPCFSIFAFTSSPFGCKSLIDCVLRVKASPFCLHLFFFNECRATCCISVCCVGCEGEGRACLHTQAADLQLVAGLGEGKKANSLSAQARIYV